GVQAAGIGQHPEQRATESLVLNSQGNLALPKCFAVRSNSQNCYIGRPVLLYLFLQPATPGNILFRLQFAGSRRRALNKVSDAITELQQLPFLVRPQHTVRDTSCVESGPEAVARPGKVMANRTREKPRVDATKQHFQSRSNDIWNMCSLRPGECILIWSLLGHL